MAFDTKRLQTFKWLDRVSRRTPSGIKDTYNPYRAQILARYGKFYATNGYILAAVEYPEFVHVADDAWKYVTAFETNGHLLEMPEMLDANRHPSNDSFFADMFIKPRENKPHNGFVFTPGLVTMALKGFEVNRLQPLVSMDETRIQFDAHNRDVCISVVVMGCNFKS